MAEAPPKPIKGPPVKLPESGEQALERLKGAGLVSDGQGDPEPWRAPLQVLRIVERDGKTSVFEFGTDAGYLSVEWTDRSGVTPWIPVRETSRFGIASIASLELIELEEE